MVLGESGHPARQLHRAGAAARGVRRLQPRRLDRQPDAPALYDAHPVCLRLHRFVSVQQSKSTHLCGGIRKRAARPILVFLRPLAACRETLLPAHGHAFHRARIRGARGVLCAAARETPGLPVPAPELSRRGALQRHAAAADRRRVFPGAARAHRRNREIRLGLDGLHRGRSPSRDRHGVGPETRRPALRVVGARSRPVETARMVFDDAVSFDAGRARFQAAAASSSIPPTIISGCPAEPRREARSTRATSPPSRAN